MKENTSLLEKLKKKLFENKTKIVKRIAGLTLAAPLLITPLSACQKTNNNNNLNPSNEQTQPIDNEEDVFSMFTPMLAGLLKDPEYKEYGKNMYFMQPHPYTFLAQQGHDIAKLKSGELSGKTISFIKDSEPNNLYMATYVENAVGYYTEYMLKYKLTNDEIDDYKLLYHLPGSQYYAIQICYINDQISKTKTPTVLSVGKMAKTAHDSLLDTSISTNSFLKYIKNDPNGNTTYNFIFKSFEISETVGKRDVLNLFFLPMPTPSSNPKICASYVVDSELSITGKLGNSGDMYISPTNPTYITRTDEQVEKFNNSKQPISLFYINGGVHHLYANLNEDFVNKHYIELKK